MRRMGTTGAVPDGGVTVTAVSVSALVPPQFPRLPTHSLPPS
ncbi:MAG: hypothetical protein ABWY04_02225 [Arthrobacter sp.]